MALAQRFPRGVSPSPKAVSQCPFVGKERLGAESAPGLFFVTQKDLVAAEADYPPPSGKSNSDGLPAPSSAGSLAMLLAIQRALSHDQRNKKKRPQRSVLRPSPRSRSPPKLL